MTYRVVQWTTGNVGSKSIHAIAADSALELVGCYAWSKDKVGHDAGELCGIAPLGVTATDDIDALLALKPDCVVYNAMFADVDHLVRILDAGINVVTTSEFITGHRLGAGRDRIAQACYSGGATIFGSGLNPGFIQLFAIVAAGISDRVDRISIVESFDTTIYNSPDTEKVMGFGYPIDAEYAQTAEDLDLPGGWRIAKGCVAGIDLRWKGFHGGREIAEVRGVWTKGQSLDPVWSMGFGYDVTIEGRPTIKTTLAFEPPPCRRSPLSRRSSRRRPASRRTTTCLCCAPAESWRQGEG